jgi:hypothetical protein
MSTISSLTPSSVNGYSTLATSATPVAQTSNSGLVQAAANLSAEANIVSTMGSGSTSTLTYDATGILNSFVQAGAASSSAQTVSSGTNAQAAAQSSTNRGVVGTLSATPATSGVYNTSGLLQGLPSNLSSNWTTALKANPSLSSSVISDSFNQGIVGTLSTTA